MPSVAGERHLAGANAVLSTVRQIMTFVGPLLGVAVAAWSPRAGFAVNAATFALSGLVIAAIRGIPDRCPSRRGPARLSPISAFVDGIGAVRSIAALGPLAALIGADVERIGLLSGAVGLGALLAMPIASRAADSPSPVRPIMFSLLATAIPTAGLAAVTTTLGASAVLIAVVGVEGSLLVVAAAVVLVGAAALWPLITIGRVAAVRQRELAPTVNALSSLAIFEGASGPSLERIAAQLVEQDLPADTVVIGQGEPAEDLFITRSGAFVVTRDSVRVGAIGSGDWFGEIGLVEGRSRTATVSTVVPTRLWRIPGDVFLDALDDAGAAPSALLDAMADRLASHDLPAER